VEGEGLTQDLPPPPVPPEADLKDFAFTPLYRARLFGSAFHARANDAEWRAGVTLWLKSQDQVPAGSLPDDDIDLCRLAELGRDLKTWRKVREGALRGWFKCSDGRLYHNVVAEVVNDQWASRQDMIERREKWRAKKRGQRERVPGEEQHPSPEKTENVPRDNALKGQGEGQRQGKEKEDARSRATRLPVDFRVPLEWLPRAAGKRAERKLPPVDMGLEADKFCNHFVGASGQNARKLNWYATFENWILNARSAPYGNTSNGKRAHQESPEDRDRRLIAGLVSPEMAGRVAAARDGAGGCGPGVAGDTGGGTVIDARRADDDRWDAGGDLGPLRAAAG
jgi:hypothetical protein